jgi:hypothetical protein
MDLATRPEVKSLVSQAHRTLVCSSPDCQIKFDFQNLRYFCTSSRKFYCKACTNCKWVFEKPESEVEERPICVCIQCEHKIQESEQNLQKALDTNEFYAVDAALTFILNRHIDIDVKILNRGETEHLRLQRELDIEQFIKSVEHVNDYKVIRKSVETLNRKVDDA